jgi:hypothetical protein
MKLNKLIICVFCLMLLTACGSSKSQRAWDACTAASGTPTGNTISGQIFEVDTVNGGSPGNDLLDTTDYSFEAVKGDYFAEATDYIGFDKEGTGTNPDFTSKLDEANAILCAEITNKLPRTCTFRNSKLKILYHNTSIHLKLLGWPSGELIAETTLDGSMSGTQCPTQAMTSGKETTRSYYGWIQLMPWLLEYYVK